MTEEEYLRMKNILNTIIEQQAGFEERHRKAEVRMDRNDQAIAALLTLAEMQEQETTRTNEQMNRGFEQMNRGFEQMNRGFEQMNSGFDRVNARFEQIATTFQDIAKKTAETDERINALVNVVERYISKN